MLIRPDGTVRFLTILEHAQRKAVVYQDRECTVSLYPNKRQSLFIEEGQGKDTYIDWFALHFGQKEQQYRKVAEGLRAIHYGCSRAERDQILLLPIEDIVDCGAVGCCDDNACQYWSHPTGISGRYAFNCVLIRYRTLGTFNQKAGLTLEEISRIYGCTRERIRQIQKRAIQRMRHYSRLDKISIFHEHIPDYRDYANRSAQEVIE
ncbi:hypothetical protein CSA56_05845 [candidate division KSB3 bacterium]|uniref:RNA polymerase sigma-70 region 4 domain-containing protein n=1 Tax=candidate division KSB3 bacterium TaxID=2044937 RepID=A0A2G6KJJ9_9BACT|nr:MAG: hypothetical protein CSA56_05845 [candidate division KSB3 bacterium]